MTSAKATFENYVGLVSLLHRLMTIVRLRLNTRLRTTTP